MVLLLLTFCLLLLPLRESVIVLCFVVLYFMSILVILMGKRELVAWLNLSSWCLMMVEWLFLAVPLGCLRFVIVVFPEHTNLLFFIHLCEVLQTVEESTNNNNNIPFESSAQTMAHIQQCHVQVQVQKKL